MNKNKLDAAYKTWKRDDPKTYHRFLVWSKAQLRKQEEIDHWGYAMPQRKALKRDDNDLRECSIYKTYFEDHLCDICHIHSCPYCREPLI